MSCPDVHERHMLTHHLPAAERVDCNPACILVAGHVFGDDPGTSHTSDLVRKSCLLVGKLVSGEPMQGEHSECARDFLVTSLPIQPCTNTLVSLKPQNIHLPACRSQHCIFATWYFRYLVVISRTQWAEETRKAGAHLQKQ